MVCRVALLVACVRGLDNECRNPLFSTHWYGKSDIPTLNSIPTVETTLKLCPQFNFQASCCNEPFEEEQQGYFDYFRNMIFVSKLTRVRSHNASVADVRHTAEYSVAARMEREQFNLALERFNPVLHPWSHDTCFTALLKYTAGVNCFGCRPDWFEYVTMEHDVVTHVHITPSVCMHLWTHCEAFGQAARRLKQALLDSALAKQAKRQAENLDMFFNQQALCSWLHNEVALHPFHRPSEVDREAAMKAAGDPAVVPAGGNGVATLRNLQANYTSNATSAPKRSLQAIGAKSLDVYKLGSTSGFQMRWGGGRSGASAVHLAALPLLILGVVAL